MTSRMRESEGIRFTGGMVMLEGLVVAVVVVLEGMEGLSDCGVSGAEESESESETGGVFDMVVVVRGVGSEVEVWFSVFPISVGSIVMDSG